MLICVENDASRLELASNAEMWNSQQQGGNNYPPPGTLIPYLCQLTVLQPEKPAGPPPPQQYYPGPSAPYAPSAPPPQNNNYGGYEPKGSGERFRSKAGIKDPFFFVFFLLQVRPQSRVIHIVLALKLS